MSFGLILFLCRLVLVRVIGGESEWRERDRERERERERREDMFLAYFDLS